MTSGGCDTVPNFRCLVNMLLECPKIEKFLLILMVEEEGKLLLTQSHFNGGREEEEDGGEI